MRLFKYFPANRLPILIERLIRFSPPSAFNDPFEFLPCIRSIGTPSEINEQIQKAAKANHSDHYLSSGLSNFGVSEDAFNMCMERLLLNSMPLAMKMMEAVIPQTQKALFDSMNNNIGVLCLSERNDDLLMWAHYGDCHKGFVLEFDSESEFFNRQVGPRDSLRHLRKVNYSLKRPALSLSEANDEDIFLTKSEHWEYEAEWRMMLPLANADKTIVVNGETICLFEFPVEAIRSVTFGAKFSEEVSSYAMKEISMLEGYEAFEFYKAKIHPTDYEILLYPAWPASF